MTNLSNQRLLAYSALAASFTAISQQASGQFYYNDFDPEVTLSAPSTFTYDELLIDLDLDGLIDFRVFVSNSLTGWGEVSSQEIVVQPNGPNAVATTNYAGGNYFARAMTVGENVSAGLNWVPGSGGVNVAFYDRTLYYGGFNITSDSPFPDGTPAFVGLRVLEDGDFYYGWLRITRVGFDQVVLVDHLLNPVPNQPVTIADAMMQNCETPTGLTAAVSGSNAALSWSPGADAVKYLVGGTRLGTFVDFRKLRTPNNLSANGLLPGTYLWRTRALCSDGAISPFSPYNTFVVTSSREQMEALDQSSEIYFDASSELLQLFTPEESVVEVWSLSGQLVHSEAVQAGRSHKNLSHLHSGIYLVQLSNSLSSERVRIVVH